MKSNDSSSEEVATGGEAITLMGLCEVPHLFLHPNQLYKFVVMPNCAECKRLSEAYSSIETATKKVLNGR